MEAEVIRTLVSLMGAVAILSFCPPGSSPRIHALSQQPALASIAVSYNRTSS